MDQPNALRQVSTQKELALEFNQNRAHIEMWRLHRNVA